MERLRLKHLSLTWYWNVPPPLKFVLWVQYKYWLTNRIIHFFLMKNCGSVSDSNLAWFSLMTIEMNLSIEYSDEYLPDTEKIDVRKKLRFVSNFHIRIAIMSILILWIWKSAPWIIWSWLCKWNNNRRCICFDFERHILSVFHLGFFLS